MCKGPGPIPVAIVKRVFSGSPAHTLIFHLQMPLFHLRLSAPHSTLDHLPLFGYVVEATNFPQNMEHLNYHLRVLRNRSLSFASISSSPQLHYIGAMQISVGIEEKCDIANLSHSIVSRKSWEQQNFTKKVQLIGQSNSTVSISDKDYKERERRKKIVLANKGRVPWNKGRKHSAETRARIKQQTIEALKDPKVKSLVFQVKKKMSQRLRSHSVETKAKMSSSLRRLWGQRLKWRRSGEKFLLSWVESIAEAAKTGGSGQQELNWDSYENIQEELYLQQLQQAAEEKKTRERAKMRAKEAAARAKSKKKARLAVQRKLDRETKKDNEGLASLKGHKVKQRSTKLDRKASTDGQVASRRDIVTSHLHISSLKKLDVELIKKEKMRAEVSFADQIRAAKDRKTERAIAAPSLAVVNQKPGMHKILQSQ